MATKSNRLATLATALETARADIEAIRDQRLTLLDRIAQVEAAPADDAEIARRIDLVLDRAEAEARDLSWLSALSGPETQPFNMALPFERQPLGALVLLGQRETVRARLIAEAGSTRKAEPMTATEREKALAKLRADARTIEIEEERALRAAEAAGTRIARREDVDPEILLAEDL